MDSGNENTFETKLLTENSATNRSGRERNRAPHSAQHLCTAPHCLPVNLPITSWWASLVLHPPVEVQHSDNCHPCSVNQRHPDAKPSVHSFLVSTAVLDQSVGTKDKAKITLYKAFLCARHCARCFTWCANEYYSHFTNRETMAQRG